MKRLWQWGIVIVTFAAFSVIGWRSFTLTMADQYARTDSARALMWRSDHPEALAFEAERLSHTEKTRRHAAALARRALRADPFNGVAYRVLAQLADADGNSERALALFQIAARRAPRDLQTHVWLINHYLAVNSLSLTLPHLDMMLRVQPESLPSVFPVFSAAAIHPQTQSTLVELLKTSPPWRQYALIMLCQQTKDIVSVSELMERLRKSPQGLSSGELSAWLRRLVAEHMWGQAYLVWASELSSERRKSIGNVFNGGFEFKPSSDYGFDWQLGRVAGATIDLLPVSGAGGRQALQVSFEDRRVLFNHVYQLLYLPVGRYELSGRARLDDIRNERGLVWSLSCYGVSPALASTEPMTGSSAWTSFSFEFEVPSQDCNAQVLQLSVPARTPIEQQISGRAWFDDIAIKRIH